ncbi:MAG: hypothetical protein Q8P88_00005, partial [Candidatus Jorgensenbacteria bacterium]|nr:hypothetical protein [Candidatus Jorgensenbacteria bacterium]
MKQPIFTGIALVILLAFPLEAQEVAASDLDVLAVAFRSVETTIDSVYVPDDLGYMSKRHDI